MRARGGRRPWPLRRPPGRAGRGGVDPLRRLKGVEAATAADLVFEAGELSRFGSARPLAAWMGLTPSEHPGGEAERRGGVAKAGNRHLRKPLAEAARHYLDASPRPKDVARGRPPDPAARRRAAKGVRRPAERRASMLERGVNKGRADVAGARELACWAWAIGCMVEEA